jgi:hypothetical protein
MYGEKHVERAACILHAGAWIETACRPPIANDKVVAPHAGGKHPLSTAVTFLAFEVIAVLASSA